LKQEGWVRRDTCIGSKVAKICGIDMGVPFNRALDSFTKSLTKISPGVCWLTTPI